MADNRKQTNTKEAGQATGKYFTVMAGRYEPEPVEMGFLDKTSGLPKGQTQKVAIGVGVLMIPNYSRVWGRRLNGNGKVPTNGRLAVTDKDYRGQIEFLEFGDPDGELIEIRYLPQSKSLDKQYQEQVQKFTNTREEDVFIYLLQGINNFDPVLDSMLIDMLKHHTLNPDNKSRNPTTTDYSFVEYSTATRQNKLQKLAVRREAESILLTAEKDDEQLQVLANIYRIDPKQQADLLVDQLMAKVELDPHNFITVLNNYRKDVQDMMLHLIDEELLDIDRDDNTIALIKDGRKSVILHQVEGDDKVKRVMWVVNNITEPAVFEAVQEMDAVKKANLALVK